MLVASIVGRKQVNEAIMMKKVFRKYIFIDEKSSKACSRSSVFGALAAAAAGVRQGRS